jgi:hypothetical protein
MKLWPATQQTDLWHVLLCMSTTPKAMLLENPNIHPNTCIPTFPHINPNSNKSELLFIRPEFYMLHQAISKPVEIHVNLRRETKGKNNDQKLWSIHVCKKNRSARLQLCEIEMGTIQATEMILPVLLGRTNLQTQNSCNFIHHGIIITTPMTLCSLRW